MYSARVREGVNHHMAARSARGISPPDIGRCTYSRPGYTTPAVRRLGEGGTAGTGTGWLKGVNKHTSAFQLWPLRSPLPQWISPPSAPLIPASARPLSAGYINAQSTTKRNCRRSRSRNEQTGARTQRTPQQALHRASYNTSRQRCGRPILSSPSLWPPLSRDH